MPREIQRGLSSLRTADDFIRDSRSSLSKQASEFFAASQHKKDSSGLRSSYKQIIAGYDRALGISEKKIEEAVKLRDIVGRHVKILDRELRHFMEEYRPDHVRIAHETERRLDKEVAEKIAQGKAAAERHAERFRGQVASPTVLAVFRAEAPVIGEQLREYQRQKGMADDGGGATSTMSLKRALARQQAALSDDEHGGPRRKKRAGSTVAGEISEHGGIEGVGETTEAHGAAMVDAQAVGMATTPAMAYSMAAAHHTVPQQLPHQHPMAVAAAAAAAAATAAVGVTTMVGATAAAVAPELYCTCRQPSYGVMVGCDNDDCPIEWFHVGCVGLESPPDADHQWYCPDCAPSMA